MTSTVAGSNTSRALGETDPCPLSNLRSGFPLMFVRPVRSSPTRPGKRDGEHRSVTEFHFAIQQFSLDVAPDFGLTKTGVWARFPT